MSDFNFIDYSLYLRHGVELNHSSSKRLSIGTQRWDEAQHGTVEGSINLGKRGWSWIVHIHHRNMTQEPRNSTSQHGHCQGPSDPKLFKLSFSFR